MIILLYGRALAIFSWLSSLPPFSDMIWAVVLASKDFQIDFPKLQLVLRYRALKIDSNPIMRRTQLPVGSHYNHTLYSTKILHEFPSEQTLKDLTSAPTWKWGQHANHVTNKKVRIETFPTFPADFFPR